jgi:uncharacterized membrane protein
MSKMMRRGREGRSLSRSLMNAIVSSVLAVSSVVLLILLSFTFFLLTESSFFQGLSTKLYSYYIAIGMFFSALLLGISTVVLFRSIRSLSNAREMNIIPPIEGNDGVRAPELTVTDITKFLDEGEREIYGLLVDAGGSMLQRDITTVKGFSKASITRILNRLESKGIIERIRHGTTNMIVLKRVSK